MSDSLVPSPAISKQRHNDPLTDWQKKLQHRYTDTCLFYPSAFTSAKRRSEGWVRRYSTSSIESGMASIHSSRTGFSSLHRRTMSLGTLPLVLPQRQEQSPTLHNLTTAPQQQEQQKSNKTDTPGSNDDDHPSTTTTASIATKTTSPSLPSNVPSTITSIPGSSNARQQNAMATKQPLSASSASELEHKSETLQQHTMIDMTRHRPTRTVRIERDYSRGDGVTRFSTDFPKELEGKINTSQFEHTIDTINTILFTAEKLSLNVFDNIMECLTIYTWPVLFSTHYQRSIKQLMSFINSENELLYHAKGISISDPVRSAFLFLEIRIYD